MSLIRSFQIMRPGKFNCSDGREFSFTKRDLEEIVETYSTEKRKAVLTANHPDDDLPELGDVKALYYDNEALYAVGRFSDRLEREVRDGTRRNRSAALFLPNSKGNPTPGKYYLKHVGFLDNDIYPAIKGMEPVQLSSGGGVVCFSASSEPVNFTDETYCNTNIRIPITRENGSKGVGFIWRGQILELNE